jgi:hypothetical protein
MSAAPSSVRPRPGSVHLTLLFFGQHLSDRIRAPKLREVLMQKLLRGCYLFVGLLALSSAANAQQQGTSAVPFEIAPPKPSTTVRTIVNPVIRSRPVDWCLVPTKKCGKPAADRYCQMMRLGRALAFDGARSNQQTIILGTNELCDTRRFSHCDQFSRIVCSGRG